MSDNAANQYRHTVKHLVENTPAEIASARAVVAANALNPDDHRLLAAVLGLEERP